MFDKDRNSAPHWERKTIEKIAFAGVKEQRKSRRWRTFFTILFFVYVTFILYNIFYRVDIEPRYDAMGKAVPVDSKSHIALVRLNGAIASDKEASAEKLSALLRRAMSKSEVKGVLLLANSPGGSPVQSSLVYQTIQELKKTFKKPIKTVITDVCASGCYYIVSATDEIYADKSSIVGSIGVISQSFGYYEAAEKLGIELRTYTSGKNKDFLNPGRKPTEEEIAFLKGLLTRLHDNFIEAVKAGRGERLQSQEELFSGLFWVGDEVKSLGLVDGFATPYAVAMTMGDYPVYDYSARTPLEKVLERFGAEAEGAISQGVKSALIPKSQLTFD